VSRILDNPQHWRKRAQEVRALVDQIDDPDTKRALLEIAGRYERLAQKAALRQLPRAPVDLF
jgi:hypothetical protein